jgi:transposase
MRVDLTPTNEYRRAMLRHWYVNVKSMLKKLFGDKALFDSSKQLVSYAGLAASARQFAETTRSGKITKQGRKRLRTICIRAVLSMVNRTKTPLMEFYPASLDIDITLHQKYSKQVYDVSSWL